MRRNIPRQFPETQRLEASRIQRPGERRLGEADEASWACLGCLGRTGTSPPPPQDERPWPGGRPGPRGERRGCESRRGRAAGRDRSRRMGRCQLSEGPLRRRPKPLLARRAPYAASAGAPMHNTGRVFQCDGAHLLNDECPSFPSQRLVCRPRFDAKGWRSPRRHRRRATMLRRRLSPRKHRRRPRRASRCRPTGPVGLPVPMTTVPPAGLQPPPPQQRVATGFACPGRRHSRFFQAWPAQHRLAQA